MRYCTLELRLGCRGCCWHGFTCTLYLFFQINVTAHIQHTLTSNVTTELPYLHKQLISQSRRSKSVMTLCCSHVVHRLCSKKKFKRISEFSTFVGLKIPGSSDLLGAFKPSLALQRMIPHRESVWWVQKNALSVAAVWSQCGQTDGGPAKGNSRSNCHCNSKRGLRLPTGETTRGFKMAQL